MAEILHMPRNNDKPYVMLCEGAYDTLKDQPGKQYKTITLAEIARLVETPQAVEKKHASFIIPSSYNYHDGRSHEIQRDMGSFRMLTFDIDEGNHSIEEVEAAIKKVVGNHAFMIYSSASASDENKKWRVLVPVATSLYGRDFTQAQLAAYELMRTATGIKCDDALSRPGQPVYLPNVPPDRRFDGEPLFYQYYLERKFTLFEYYGSAIEEHAEWKRKQEEQAQEEARRLAEKRAAERAERRVDRPDDIDPIAEFNARHSVADTLLRYGYERQGASKQYRSPYQSTGSYATKDFGDHWVSLSGSDAAAGLGAQKSLGEIAYCWGDAFDLYAHFEHGGDMTKAIREYAAELRPPAFEAPTDPLADFDIVPDEISPEPEPSEIKADSTADEISFDDTDALPDPAADLPEEDMWPTPVTQFDSSLLPRREWVYGHDYIRKYVSVIASAGGIGKTSLTVVEALAIVTGRDLLGTTVKEQTNVWVVNLEDPRSEIEMRTLAAMQHYDIKPKDVRGKLFMDGEDTFSVTLATENRDGLQLNDAMADLMIQKIKDNDIGVVMLDPFIGLHTVNENSNSGIQALVAMVRRIAREANCSIQLVHHVRKGNGDDAGIDSVRGAGALIGAARAARVINRISEDDAMKMGVDEKQARGIFRVDDGKANLAPPADKAVYRRMIGVQIDNEEWIGVAVPFEMPDAFAGITAKLARKCQDIVGGAEDREEPLRASSQAKNWCGHSFAAVLGIDTDEKAGKARMTTVVNTWLREGVLKKQEVYSKRDGRDVPAVIVGEWITPEEIG